jgi:hypothetical protein
MNWHLPITNIPSNTFNTYKVRRTPYLLLVNNKGIVVQSLFGSDPNNACQLDLKINKVLNLC